jgi:hypothetical protein
MLFHHLGRNARLSLLTVMLVGDLRSAPQFAMGLSFLFSNSEV